MGPVQVALRGTEARDGETEPFRRKRGGQLDRLGLLLRAVRRQQPPAFLHDAIGGVRRVAVPRRKHFEVAGLERSAVGGSENRGRVA